MQFAVKLKCSQDVFDESDAQLFRQANVEPLTN